MMAEVSDRLLKLLPVVYRQRDAEQGYPLRALLRIIGEQIDVVEHDINQLYDNWFVETAEDWVVPYIGDLVGYRLVHEAGQPGDVRTPVGRLRNKILVPRREVANTVRYRRRKGTLAVLELLARDVVGWRARAVEFYRLLSFTQGLNHQRPERGRTVDLRQGDALEWVDGPFDTLAHTVDVRRIDSHRTLGAYNIPDVGVFVWRLRAYPVSRTPAYCREEVGPHCFTFSVLGNDSALYNRPQPEESPTDIAGEVNLPVPIRRRAMEQRLGDYYGPEKCVQIWEGALDRPVTSERIVVADLSDWRYRPMGHQVAVDPVLGRIAYPPGKSPKPGVWVSYHYAFSADIGGGEYWRELSQAEAATVYRVGQREAFQSINAALSHWQQEQPVDAVIELVDSGVYVEQIGIELKADQTLQLRAANRRRPVIRLLDWQTDRPDALTVTGAAGSRFTLDGLLITGRGMMIEGELASLHVRHSTLVPGWTLDPECEPARPAEPSLEFMHTRACVVIEDSIVGAIRVQQDEVATDPVTLRIRDSILDATSDLRQAVSAPGERPAHAVMTIIRTTVIGRIDTHAIELGENCLFLGQVWVARRMLGCLRFCYVTPGSRTPRRYRCQPELVENSVVQMLRDAARERGEMPPDAQIASARVQERLRVRPLLNSLRYGTPGYCQLAFSCTDEILRGADDESEMGVFHNLFNPQRDANLRARLAEYVPAGMASGVLYAN